MASKLRLGFYAPSEQPDYQTAFPPALYTYLTYATRDEMAQAYSAGLVDVMLDTDAPEFAGLNRVAYPPNTLQYLVAIDTVIDDAGFDGRTVGVAPEHRDTVARLLVGVSAKPTDLKLVTQDEFLTMQQGGTGCVDVLFASVVAGSPFLASLPATLYVKQLPPAVLQKGVDAQHLVAPFPADQLANTYNLNPVATLASRTYAYSRDPISILS